MCPVTARRWAGPCAFLAAATLLVAPASAGAATAVTPLPTSTAALPQAPSQKTEAQKVDRVATPQADWFDCTDIAKGADCANIPMPLDYDKPKGQTTDVAALRLKATGSKAEKLGTLFLNPGGPGGSGVQMAASADFFLSPELRQRFDVVGFDPRGTNFSDNVACWDNLGQQSDALQGFNVAFPFTKSEKKAYISSSEAFGQACATTGTPLSESMSTAEVARDMDLLRRMVGDEQLSFLGFSYGSYLGNVYANMFPDRVRAVVIDGVLDPEGWAGTKWNKALPQTQRIKSGQGAAKALKEILERCKAAGEDYCQLAADGDPAKAYQAIVASLKKEPLVVSAEGETFELSYAMLTSLMLNSLYAPDAGTTVDGLLAQVSALMAEPGAQGSALAKRQSQARKDLAARITEEQKAAGVAAKAKQRIGKSAGWAFPYSNAPEAFQSVLCTDGTNPYRAGNWTNYADYAQILAPDFGPLWTWSSAPCAGSTWTARDEDSYRGTFDHDTANPVLVVGNYWDPATSYDGAVNAASLLPKSRLLSSTNWGHTAYGTSDCATGAVDAYLLKGKLPAQGTVCEGDIQPFTVPLDEQDAQKNRRMTPDRGLPPVVPPIPGAVPRS